MPQRRSLGAYPTYATSSSNEYSYSQNEMSPQNYGFMGSFQNYGQFDYSNRSDSNNLSNSDYDDSYQKQPAQHFHPKYRSDEFLRNGGDTSDKAHKDEHRSVDTNPFDDGPITTFGFMQGYSMQTYYTDKPTEAGNNKGGDCSAKLPPKKSKDKRLSDNSSEEDPKEGKQTLGVKEARARRKSSTLDMFNDPANFMQQVEKHLESVPEQHSNETKPEEVTKSKKNNVSSNSLRSKLLEKKSSLPYKPSNYQPSHLSPSPKRSHQLQAPGLHRGGGKDFYNPQFTSNNHENQNFMEPKPQLLNLKLTKTYSANPGPYQPLYQGGYGHSVGYNDGNRMPGYGVDPRHGHMVHPGMMHYPENPRAAPGAFMPPMQYGQFERETYSPDISHNAFIEVPEYRRLSTNENTYAQGRWNEYSSPQLPPTYGHPAQSRLSAPEIKLNFKSESSHSSNLDKKSNSQGDDCDKSLKDFDESSPTPEIPLAKLIEGAPQMARDQSGCRLLQKKIEEGDPETITAIYNSILPNFVDLMNNPFGNYLCQKITDSCGKDQLKAIIKIIEKEVVDICRNSHGTRAVQKIVECAHDRELIDLIIDLLKDHVRVLVEDINGNHAIQKILFTFKAPDNEFIFETMIGKCKEIACHKHGC